MNAYASILPEMILTLTCLLVLIWKMAFGDGKSVLYLALVGLVATGGATIWTLANPIGSHPPMIVTNGFSQFMLLLLLVCGVVILLYSFDFLWRHELPYTEWTFLLVASLVGLSLMLSTDHLLVIFIALELFSLSFYVLCGYRRDDRTSSEASLKYFILGSVGSAFLLLGIGLLYASAGSLEFMTTSFWGSHNVAFWGSLVLFLGGMLFKLALVPLHVWVPDVYQGAPTPVTGYMSIVVKIAVFGVLIQFLYQYTVHVEPVISLTGILWWLAALTMVVGNLLALVQEEIKRMLAYSSIAHAGYGVVGLVAGPALGYTAVVFYLCIYMVMNLVAFGVVSAISSEEDRCRYSDLHGLSLQQPLLAFGLAVSMISLAGLPITAGFMGKLVLFYAAVEQGYVLLVVLAVLMSVVSVAFYFRVIVHSYMKQPADDASPVRMADLRTTMIGALGTALLLIVGLFPYPLYRYVESFVTIVTGGLG